MLLHRCFGGHSEAFDGQIDDQLKGIEGTPVERVEGKARRYPIGTCAVITADKEKYLVFALARTDPATSKAYSDVTALWAALRGLWERARVEASGEPLNLPLVGSGLSGLGLPSRDLLRPSNTMNLPSNYGRYGYSPV